MVRDIEKIEEKRRYALSRSEAVDYYLLCDELGVAVEDERLYELGRGIYAAREIERKNDLESRIESPPPHIISFIEMGDDLRIGTFEDTHDKLVALQYFPKFQPDGTQPITNYDPDNPSDMGKIGVIFRKNYRFYRKRYDEFFSQSEQH